MGLDAAWHLHWPKAAVCKDINVGAEAQALIAD
jgi:hypothetical protein